MTQQSLPWLQVHLIKWIRSCKTFEQLTTCESLVNDWFMKHPAIEAWNNEHPTIQHEYVTELATEMQLTRVKLQMLSEQEIEERRKQIQTIVNQ